MRVMKSRVKVARRNLELCFPHLTAAQREKMVKENFSHTGMALFDTAAAWFWPDWRVRKHVKYEGLEHLHKLEAEGKGALLIAIHNVNLELGARAFGLETPGIGVYRPNDNPVFDWIQFRGRSRSNPGMRDRKDVKGMLYDLKYGKRLWYAPDHDYGRRRGTFAPLFAVEKACTTTGTSILADASGCALVPFTFTKDRQGKGYTLKIDEPLDAFPHNDPDNAAAYMNKAIERSIMRAPEQYMWLHRRFKTRPEGEPSLY